MYMQELEMNQLFHLCPIFPNATGDISSTEAEAVDPNTMKDIYEAYSGYAEDEERVNHKRKISDEDKATELSKKALREIGEGSGTSQQHIQ